MNFILKPILGVTDIPGNICGAFMSKRGSFQCSKCAPNFGKPISCYYVLQSKGTGHIHLTLNLTEIDEHARITIRQGVHGHNLLEDTLKQPGSYTKIARGTTMVIGLELPTAVWPAVSFSFDFETRGDSNVRTGGCGGILRDFQFITNPGYPSRMTKDDVCVWVFYAQTPRVRLEFTSLNMTSIFGSAASLEIYDGDKITDPLLRIYDKESGSPVESTGNAMLIYFHSYLSTSAPGFSAFVRGV
ncbi:hypothetical protein D915_001667 [Fasciola hepatica]|uniref:CUB domain-containing protein n=1 Tax=Fasciola hepatica TaxID=6192 RepID=A0A4E0RWS8_FASHE|nr:hypothetical protein D915_001667 [Fasciola hepatica]